MEEFLLSVAIFLKGLMAIWLIVLGAVSTVSVKAYKDDFFKAGILIFTSIVFFVSAILIMCN